MKEPTYSAYADDPAIQSCRNLQDLFEFIPPDWDKKNWRQTIQKNPEFNCYDFFIERIDNDPSLPPAMAADVAAH